MHNRKLLAKLSLCAWQVLSDYLKAGVAAGINDESIKLGCVITVQTFGELVNFNPHLHVIASSGCFTGNGTNKTDCLKATMTDFWHNLIRWEKSKQ